MFLTKSLTKLDYRQAFELDSEQNIITDAACSARSTFPSLRAPGRLFLFDDYLIFRVDADAADKMDDQTKRTISNIKATAQSTSLDSSVNFNGTDTSFAIEESQANYSLAVGMND